MHTTFLAAPCSLLNIFCPPSLSLKTIQSRESVYTNFRQNQRVNTVVPVLLQLKLIQAITQNAVS